MPVKNLLLVAIKKTLLSASLQKGRRYVKIPFEAMLFPSFPMSGDGNPADVFNYTAAAADGRRLFYGNLLHRMGVWGCLHPHHCPLIRGCPG